MATTKTDAQKVTELRKQAQDKTLPQEVRDMADKKANAIEGKSVEKETGMKLAKGGAVKAAPKKLAFGGFAGKTSMTDPGAPAKNPFAKAAASAQGKAVDTAVRKQMEAQGSKSTQPANAQPAEAQARLDAARKQMQAQNYVSQKAAQQAKPMMAKGGAVVAKAPKKAPMKEAAKQPMKKLAKGGMAKKGC